MKSCFVESQIPQACQSTTACLEFAHLPDDTFLPIVQHHLSPVMKEWIGTLISKVSSGHNRSVLSKMEGKQGSALPSAPRSTLPSAPCFHLCTVSVPSPTISFPCASRSQLMIRFKAAFNFGVNASARSLPVSFLHSVSLGPQTAVAFALRSSCQICSRVHWRVTRAFTQVNSKAFEQTRC
jgi:hypothetical protein